MSNVEKTVKLGFLLLALLGLGGCNKSPKEQDRVATKVEELINELARVEVILLETRNKAETVEAELADALDAFEKEESETYDTVRTCCRKLEERIGELAKRENVVIQEAKNAREMSEELDRRLKREEAESRQLQERVKKLEETVRRLQV